MNMIERVARAIAGEEHGRESAWEIYAEAARAAIIAMREPTHDMLVAGTEKGDETYSAYRAMIDAALSEDE